jgi:hypothetical protein
MWRVTAIERQNQMCIIEGLCSVELFNDLMMGGPWASTELKFSNPQAVTQVHMRNINSLIYYIASSYFRHMTVKLWMNSKVSYTLDNQLKNLVQRNATIV